MNPNALSRVVRGYDKRSEFLAQQIELDGVSLDFLQKLTGLDADDPMLDCYLLNESQFPSLHGGRRCDFDSERFNWFLECDLREH